MKKEKYIVKSCGSLTKEYVSIKGLLENNKKCGKWTYFHNYKQKSIEGSFENDKLKGKWEWWYENGQKQAVGIFKKGYKHGKFTYWYEDGQKYSEGEYIRGKRKRKFDYWDESGKKIVKPFNRIGLSISKNFNQKVNSNLWISSTLFSEWIRNMFRKENYFIDNMFLIQEFDEESLDLFLDKVEKKTIIFYSIGGVNLINDYFEKYEIEFWNHNENSISKSDLYDNVLDVGVGEYLSGNMMKNLYKNFVKSNYTDKQIKMMKKGRSDFEKWLEHEKFVVQSFCDCIGDYLIITKTHKKTICKECGKKYEYIDYLYEKKDEKIVEEPVINEELENSINVNETIIEKEDTFRKNIYSFPHKYNFYDEDKLQEEFDIYCSQDKMGRIFFEGPVTLIKQELNGGIYRLKGNSDCIIKVPNMSHLRMSPFPYPEYFDILLPVIDRRLWGTKIIIQILSGLIPVYYIGYGTVKYYLYRKSLSY